MKNLLLLICTSICLSVSAQKKVDGFYSGVLFNDSTKMLQKYELLRMFLALSWNHYPKKFLHPLPSGWRMKASGSGTSTSPDRFGIPCGVQSWFFLKSRLKKGYNTWWRSTGIALLKAWPNPLSGSPKDWVPSKAK